MTGEPAPPPAPRAPARRLAAHAVHAYTASGVALAFAAESGFANQQMLSFVFKKATGSTPGAFRRERRK